MRPHGPIRLASPSELVFQVNANGSIRRIDHRDVIVNAFLGNEIEGGPANLFLRRLGVRIEWTPLLGPRSPGAVRLNERGLEVAGEWDGLRFRVSLRLAASAPSWLRHVEIENAGQGVKTIDLLYAQDFARADCGGVRLNEYYISQYVDPTPLVHSTRGVMLSARQNLSIGGRHPWALVGSLAKALSFCTDGLQLHGLATRAGGVPFGLEAESLPGVLRQHEHALAVIRDAPVRPAPDTRAALGFFGWLEPDHPGASATSDLTFADAVRSGAVGVEGGWRVYSRGAGIAVRLVREHLLGLRLRRSSIGIDPVLPRTLDGLTAHVEIAGRRVELSYRVGHRGHGPQSLLCNGAPLAFVRESNPYREGGVVVAIAAFRERLCDAGNQLLVELD